MLNETYDQDEILQALDDVEGRIAGIRFILSKAQFDPVDVDEDEVKTAARKGGRVSRKKGC